MRKKLDKLHDILNPYYSLLVMLVFFGTCLIAIFNFIFVPSDLSIIVKDERVNYPDSFRDNIDKISNYIADKDTLKTEVGTVYSFIIQTTDYKKITLKNLSSKTLRGINFKRINSKELNGWAISSNYLTGDEENELLKNLKFDKQRNIIYTQKDLTISPNSDIFIHLWGSFTNNPLGDDIIVSYEGGEGSIEQNYEISGLKGYIYDNTFEILLIMVLIFVVVYSLGIKQINKEG